MRCVVVLSALLPVELSSDCPYMGAISIFIVYGDSVMKFIVYALYSWGASGA